LQERRSPARAGFLLFVLLSTKRDERNGTRVATVLFLVFKQTDREDIADGL
jgi:hypothetical protein